MNHEMNQISDDLFHMFVNHDNVWASSFTHKIIKRRKKNSKSCILILVLILNSDASTMYITLYFACSQLLSEQSMFRLFINSHIQTNYSMALNNLKGYWTILNWLQMISLVSTEICAVYKSENWLKHDLVIMAQMV